MELKLVENPILLDCSEDFSRVKPEHYTQSIAVMISAGKALLKNTDGNISPLSNWNNTIEPYLHFCMRLERMVSLASHLEAVANCPKWRSAYNNSLPMLSDFYSQWSHHKGLYLLFKAFKSKEYFRCLPPEQRKYVNNLIRDAELNGVNLSIADKGLLNDISASLAAASNKFSNNVLDASDAWHLDCRDKEMLAGLSDDTIESLIADSKITLRDDLVCQILRSADNRYLREQVYKAWVSRGASDVGPHSSEFDNSGLITEILQLRHKEANLLGFPTYAHLSLASKDAGSPAEVISFLERIGEKAKSTAEAEYNKVAEFAAEELNIKDLKHWDFEFVCEKMRNKFFDLNNDEVREYFPCVSVIQSLFIFANELYGINFKPNNQECYHNSVIVYDVYDTSDEFIGKIVFDLYSRKGKRSGAWVSSYQDKAVFKSEENTPVVFLVCNFTQAIDSINGFLTHDDVITLLHEFGHAMHCLLTRIETFGVSGFSGVSWDLIEWPSQWMECWGWLEHVILGMSCHKVNGSNLPSNIIQGIISARLFNCGIRTVKQVEYALTDMLIHSAESALSLQQAAAIHREISDRFSIWPKYEGQRFLNSFSHIFAGGYAAGYYSYLWSEVIAIDSFFSINQKYLEDNVGKVFMDNILSVGGMLEVNTAFKKMFDREVSAEHFFNYLGLDEHE